MVPNHIDEDQVIRIKRNPWAEHLFRPLIITIMIMCLNISIVNMVRLVNPAWNGAYFLLGMLLTTVEAIYSYRVLHHWRSRGISVLRYRLAELAVLILLLKLLSFMDKPLAYVAAQLHLLWQQPFAFLTIEFYIIIVLAFIAWMMATETIEDFEALYDPYSDNRMPLDSLASRFFWGGIILLLISGITQWVARAGAASLTDWGRPSLGGVIVNVLVYFVLGLVLLSQVNLTRLMVRWRIQKIAVAPGLIKQWAKYGVIFLGLVGLVAFLLPTQYTLGFLTTAGYVVQFMLGVLVFIFQLLFLLVTIPISWLLSFFGVAAPNSGNADPPVPPPAPQTSSGPAPPWLEILRSLVFWLVTLAIVGYLIKSYLDDHPELPAQLKRFKLLRGLFNLLSQLWQRLTAWAQTGLDMLPKKIRRASGDQNPATTNRHWNLFGFRNLSPRERILHYYLNILKRAQTKGAGRQGHQTPYEYQPHLQQSAPDVQTEIQLITDTFVHARYSREPFNKEQVTLVKALWQRIRKALQQGKRAEE